MRENTIVLSRKLICDK